MNIKFMEWLIFYLYPFIFIENYFLFTKKRFPGILNIFKNYSFFCYLVGFQFFKRHLDLIISSIFKLGVSCNHKKSWKYLFLKFIFFKYFKISQKIVLALTLTLFYGMATFNLVFMRFNFVSTTGLINDDSFESFD